MKTRIFLATGLLAPALALGACSQNYAGEGALAGAAVGAAAGVVTGNNVGRSAAIGAAAGAVGGALIRKDGKCYREDRYGDVYQVDCPR